MIPNEKAVAVAKDVLSRLDKLELQHGYYIRGQPDDLKPEMQLQEHVEKIEETCNVCLLGACVLSKARLFNALTLKDAGMYLAYDHYSVYATRRETVDALSDIFDPVTMCYMEAAFEKKDNIGTSGVKHEPEFNYKELAVAVEFGEQFDTRRDCVAAVMQQVIEQGGVWRPQIPARS